MPSSTEAQHTILVIDDTKENLTVIGELLQPFYRVRVANSGARGLKAASTHPRPDLILLDVMMPEMDGYAVIKALRENPETSSIPVIFVTAMDGDQDEERGLSLGAVDYITKPIRPSILLARVRTHLELKQSRDWLKGQNGYLENEISKRMQENDLIKDVSLNALALLAEKRDNETGNHLHRTQTYIEALMTELAEHPRFAAGLQEPMRTLIAKAAPLHDIGKVGIPDDILLKPAKLTPDEFEIMKQHSAIGANAITEAIRRVIHSTGAQIDNAHSPLQFLEVARQIAMHHHEKWNGQGYPGGLVGDAIPLPARLMALADVFDALTCRRHYKEAFPVERARSILVEGKNVHFDPDIVAAYLKIEDHFVDIAHRFADPH